MRRRLGDTLGIAMSTIWLGIVVVRRGDVARASALFAEGMTIARAKGVMWGVIGGFLGMSLVLRHMGQLERAAQLLGCSDAVVDATGIIVKPGDDRLFLDHRQHLREQLGDSAFRAALQDGHALPLDAAVEAALAVWMSEDPPPRAELSRDSVHSPLTPREREIAALIARGHTNRQVAATLSISQRTVDTHVSRILHKCGLSSRAQLVSDGQS
jgi:non-specific serine/threonine protein kinase